MHWLGAAGFGAMVSKIALAGTDEAAARINEITGGAEGDDALIILDLPEIAENGNAVKVAFDIDSPMTEEKLREGGSHFGRWQPRTRSGNF